MHLGPSMQKFKGIKLSRKLMGAKAHAKAVRMRPKQMFCSRKRSGLKWKFRAQGLRFGDLCLGFRVKSIKQITGSLLDRAVVDTQTHSGIQSYFSKAPNGGLNPLLLAVSIFFSIPSVPTYQPIL